MDEAKGKTESPTIGLSLNAQFAAGRTVVFQTYVPQDVSPEGISVILQKLNWVADREEAFYAQEQARKQLEVEENAAANIARRLGEIEHNIQTKSISEGRRNPKLSAQDEIQKKQAVDTVEESKRRIAACKKHLAELIEKAGRTYGASGPANN